MSEAATDVFVFPASFAQQRLWFVEEIAPGRSTYNVSVALRIRGALDIGALRSAITLVVHRHEVLRTTFAIEDGAPVQVVHVAGEVPLGIVDLQTEPDSRVVALAALHAEARRPFDLRTGPLVRFTLFHVAAAEYLFLISLHHIVADGWSIGVLYGELSEGYAAAIERREPALPALAIQYADYVLWQRAQLTGDALSALEAYWQEQLRGPLPVLEFPAAWPRPANYAGGPAGRRGFRIPDALAARLDTLARREHVTPFMLYLAAFQLLLARYAGTEDIVVGSPVAGRGGAGRDLETLIGLFVNTLALRVDFSGDPTFIELLARVREVSLAGFAHEALPFDRVVAVAKPDRDLSRTPIFQALFTMQNAVSTASTDGPRLTGLAVERVGTKSESAMFELGLTLAPDGASYRASVEYDAGLFSGESLARFEQHYLTLLESAAAAPETKAAALPLLSEAERHKVLIEWNDTRAGYPEHATIHSLIDAQVRHRPDAVAVECFDNSVRTSLTYAELDRRANRVAWALHDAGVRLDDRVAICLGRSVNMVIAILGVLKSGGAYVPLDAAYPDERLEFMLRDAGARLLVTERVHSSRLARLAKDVVHIDLDQVVRGGARDDAPPSDVSPSNLAYVIYTSGSTGRPKGVMVEHRNVTRLLVNDRFPFTFGETDVWTVFHSFAFDFSVWELFGALAYGGRAIVVPRVVAQSPADFLALLEATGTTVLNQVPPAFYALMDEALIRRPTLALRYVIFGGEALKPTLLREWHIAWPSIRLINMFGITETTVHVTFKEIGDAEIGEGRSNIGRPIPTMTTYLLDAKLRPVPVGVAGEICVGGLGVTRGYLNRPELTADRFVPDTLGSGERLYRSGDLGRFLPDGEIEYLGRRDDQVKIRGVRIELGEIEAALLQQPGVTAAAAIVRHDSRGEQQIVAYVVRDDAAASSPAEMRDRTRQSLPAVMVPTALVFLDQMPLTSNGKVDRKALPAPGDDARAVMDAYVEPRNALAREIVDVWESLLSVKRIGVNDDFFDLGGNSLLAIRMIAEVERVSSRKFQLRWLLEHPTIAEIVALVLADISEEEERGLPILQSGGPGTPLAFAHGDVLGDGWYCRRLAPLLGSSPLIVLPTYRPGPDSPLSIEAMARAHVDRLRAVQPHGPYRVGGFCIGGLVAFEMARILSAQGEQVEAVVMVDAFFSNLRFRALEPMVRWLSRAPTPEARLDRRARIYGWLRYYTWRIRAVRRMSMRERFRWAGAAVRRRLGNRNTLGPPLDAVQPAEQQAGAIPVVGLGPAGKFITRAQRGYMPGHFPGRVHLIWAAGAIGGSSRSGAFGGGWEGMVDEFESHIVGGIHDDLVMPQGLPVLAAAIRASLGTEPARA